MGKKKGKSDKKSESQQQAQSQPQGRSTSQPQAAQQASAQQPQSRPPSQPQASQQARAQQPQSKPTSQPQVPQQRRSQQPQGWPTYQPQVPQQRRSQQPQGWPTYQPQVPQQGRPQQPQGWPTSQPQVLQQPSAQQPQGWPTFQPQVPQQASAQQPQGWPTSQPQVLQQARAQQPQSRPSSQPQPPSQGQSSRGKPKQPKKDTDEPKPRKKSQKNAPRQCEDTTGVADDFETMSISSGSVASSSTPTKTIPTLALFPVTQNIGSGTKGRRVMVDVNFVALCIEKLLPTVYQYDVTIEPALPKRWLPKIFEVYRQKNFNNIFVAFDGKKIAVSPKILPVNDKIEKETKVTDENGRERVYMVSMKEARDSKIDFRSLKNYTSMRQYDAPLRAMQMLEIVLKAPFLDKDGVQAGRSFFLRPGAKERYDLGDNYELWTGLYQATVLGSRPYLNVDIAHKAFPSERRVCDILIGVDLKRQLDPKNASSLQSHLNGLMIKYSLPGNNASCRSFKFMRLAADSKTEKFINDADKKEYTIESYFRSRGVTIQYPLLPTLKLGNSIKNITVPLELCVVDGNQAVNKKCTEMQTRNMIRVAATSTDIRRQKIMDMLGRISHNRSETLRQFGVGVGNEFANVPARILDAPTLQYNNMTVRPNRGKWNVGSKGFYRAARLTKYAVLVLDNNVIESNVREFCTCINRLGASNGIQIDPDYLSYWLDQQSRNIRNDILRDMPKMIERNVELLFVVIPDRGDFYAKVKQCAELECGILTQCVKANTIRNKRNDQSTVTNILLKVNAKLNGTNHKFFDVPPLMKRPFMIIGADVTHPSPGQEDIPSVVGVVASHDLNGFLYNKSWRLQDPKQEIISGFDHIIIEHLQFFEKKNKCLPEVILYFRDGVSEGQFQQVLTAELNAIYRGCQQFSQDYKPKVTFIVVQKRHHTRFFPPPNSGIGRDDHKNNNVPPGTIVDSQITHPNETQFYLVSHQSLQGVARPTKYCLLRDDSNFSMDTLEELTYNLCHFFARCTRTVSYPAPTYYAHLAAARGRVYIEGRNINMSKLDKEFNDRTVKQHIIENHPMHFI